MTATDLARSPDLGVIHSFWIPRLAGKQDLVPGHTTYLNLQADAAGPLPRAVRRVLRAEPREHAGPRRGARVRTTSPPGSPRSARLPTVPAAGSLEARGRELFGDLGARQACASCHQVWEGNGLRGPAQGPDLTHLMSRLGVRRCHPRPDAGEPAGVARGPERDEADAVRGERHRHAEPEPDR
jgi:cytochrome c oxidase subunit II